MFVVNKLLADIYELNRYKEKENAANNFNCKECSFYTLSKLELVKQVLNHKAQYTYKCNMCRFEDKAIKAVEDHKINKKCRGNV